MTVLKVLSGLALLSAVVLAFLNFEKYVARQYGFRFLTKSAFLAAAASAALIIGGCYWWEDANRAGGDTLNGVVLVLLGAGSASMILVRNIQRTNWLVGTSGTAAQAVAFAIAAYLGVFVLMFAFIATVLGVRRIRW